jgi:hypothetical protein
MASGSAPYPAAEWIAMTDGERHLSDCKGWHCFDRQWVEADGKA